MKAIEIFEYLNEIAPFVTAAAWDNAGFLIGDKNARVTKCLVALDVTGEEIEQAVLSGAEMIVSHHPVIFHAKKDFLSGDVAFEAAKNNLAVVCAHTNLDKAVQGVNDTLCECLGMTYEKLPETIGEGFLNVGTLPFIADSDALAKHIAEKLNANVRYLAKNRKINKIAVCSGAGGDLCQDAALMGCDAFITGDASYHDFLNADEAGVSLFAAGHFETEVIIVPKLIDVLSLRFPEVAFIPSKRQNPIVTTEKHYGI